MKVTNEAKEALKAVFEENGADGLIVTLQETCCGKSPVFQLAAFDEDDKPETIDGIDIVIPDEAKDVVDAMEIDLVNGELVVLNTVCGCGEGGCGHHDCDHED